MRYVPTFGDSDDLRFVDLVSPAMRFDDSDDLVLFVVLLDREHRDLERQADRSSAWAMTLLRLATGPAVLCPPDLPLFWYRKVAGLRIARIWRINLLDELLEVIAPYGFPDLYDEQENLNRDVLEEGDFDQGTLEDAAAALPELWPNDPPYGASPVTAGTDLYVTSLAQEYAA